MSETESGETDSSDHGTLSTKGEILLQKRHAVRNVQVVVNEATTVNVALSLMDEEGVFLEVEPFQRDVQEFSESEETLQKLAEAE